MTMQIDDLYGAGMIHQWGLSDAGQAICVADGVASGDPAALATLKKNAAVRALVGPVEAYEAAQAIVARGEPDNGQPKYIPDPYAVRPDESPDDWTPPLIDNPDWALLPRTVETVGQDGEPETAPEPRWQAYDAAAATVAGASSVTVAHALWRAGDPTANSSTVLADLTTRAAQPLDHDPRPFTDEVSDRQFWQAAAMLGWITSDEALAAVTIGAIPSIIATEIAKLSPPQKFAITMAVAGSNTFRFSNPATPLLMNMMGKTPNDAMPIWRLAATLA